MLRYVFGCLARARGGAPEKLENKKMAYGRERKGDHSPAPRPKCPTAAITASNDTRQHARELRGWLSVTCELCHHEALMNVDAGRPIGRCDLLRAFNHGLWRNLAVHRLGRRRLGPSPGHIEEGFSFCLVLRSASPAKAIFGKLPIFIGRGHTALPSVQTVRLSRTQGRYHVARLLAELGARSRLTDWLHERTARSFPPLRLCLMPDITTPRHFRDLRRPTWSGI
jgi:hypothetical protein